MHQINVILKKQLHISTFCKLCDKDLEGKWRITLWTSYAQNHLLTTQSFFWNYRILTVFMSGVLTSFFFTSNSLSLSSALATQHLNTPPLKPSMDPDTACWDTSEIGPNQTRHQILHISCHTCIFHNRWSEYGTLWHSTKIIVKFLYVREIYGFYIFTIHYITLVLS